MVRASTTKEFVEKATAIHGDKYSYADALYSGWYSLVTIFCTLCQTTFQQKAGNHLSGGGCQKCAARGHPKCLTQQEFILRARKRHGNDFDYDLVDYINQKTPVRIRCIRHDVVFQQAPCKHMEGRGCPACSRGYSYHAIDWLDFKAAEDSTYIQHQLNGGEVMIPGVGKVDGFSVEHNKVYEFHGSLYHGNPTMYSGSTVSKINKKRLNCELYFKTVEREFKLSRLGYAYEEIWDLNWGRILRAVKIIQFAYRCHQQGKPFRKRSRYPGKHSKIPGVVT